MADAHVSNDVDFTVQMESLVAQAQQHLDSPAPRQNTLGFIQMLRPMVVGIEALCRTTAENTGALQKLKTIIEQKEGSPALPLLMANVQQSLDAKTAINKQLFDAFYQELTSYKDAALIEALHKPIIRDLITLYDDVSGIQQQVDAFVDEHKEREEIPPGELPLLHFTGNLAHNIGYAVVSLVEILARLDVTTLECTSPKIDKVNQRAVQVEFTDIEEEDGDILKRVKLGFIWRGRLFRPEEVIVKKWNRGLITAMKPEKQL
ncbi:MAG: hypothetical protein M3O82_06840 [Verrucomicrobiota bacterium]|nr:hypothetical protein [Verrucomicrobiota bacterium]